MGQQRRIETQEAKALRSKRQHFAAPGGSHDTLIGILARVLPMLVGVVAAFMIITPLSPGSEVSFLLDRDKVAMIDERLSVDKAMYRGRDDKDRPFSVTAGSAVQRSSAEGLVRMKDLAAQLILPEGPARIIAPGGAYDIRSEVVSVNDALRMEAADGYRMVARGVSIDMKNRTMSGDEGVEGEIPAVTFSANSARIDLDARIIALEGNARVRMVPGQLRIPQTPKLPR